MATVIRETETSCGLVELQFATIGSMRPMVVINTPDSRGWFDEGTEWVSSERDRSLADAIVEATGLPVDEAEQLASSTLDEWRERGVDVGSRSDTLKGVALVTAIGGGILLAVGAVVATIWVVATQLL